MTAPLLVHTAHIAQAMQAVHAIHAVSGLAAATSVPHPTSVGSGSISLLSGTGGATGGAKPKHAYDDFLAQLLQFLIFLANLVGAVIIAIAIIRELLVYLYQLVRNGGRSIPDKEAIRLSLGRSLALALEFQLGADILGTALDPSAQDLIVLGAVALLRTFLNYSLSREIDAEARRINEAREGLRGQEEQDKPVELEPGSGQASAMATVRRKLGESG
jgi:uncharacterized membrane protein